MTDYDSIVIGSGAGGLTAALCLAQAGQKVAVLEQHEVPGGWCHTFRLDRFRFSPGVHYIGELGRKGRTRLIYSGLGVGRDLTFFQLKEDAFEHVIIGGGAGGRRFDLPSGRRPLAEYLKGHFPAEAAGIDAYIKTVWDLNRQLLSMLEGTGPMAWLGMPFRAPVVARYATTSLAGYLNKHIHDPMLATLLSIQAGDYGLAPKRAPFAVHASVAAHYFDGGYYPHKGGASIANAFVRAIKREGGELHLRTRVERILIEGRRAVGVRLSDGTELRAKRVISNADPDMTYRRLIGEENLGWRLRRKVRRTRYSGAAVSLFSAVKMDLPGAGFDSGNYWYADALDPKKALAVIDDPNIAGLESLPSLFLTVTSLKDRTKFDGENHTVEAFVFVPYELFEPWADSQPGERPAEYEDLKKKLTDAMIRTADKIIPGFSDNLVFCELGTPLTNIHYVQSARGNAYGTEKTGGQIGPFGFSVRTPFENLHTCGASTVIHGILGVTLSGMFVAADILKCNFMDLLPHDDEVTVLPADDPSVWPQSLRYRLEGSVDDAQRSAG